MAEFIECRLEEGSSSEESDIGSLPRRDRNSTRSCRVAALSLAIFVIVALALIPARVQLRQGDMNSGVALFGPLDFSDWTKASLSGPLHDVRHNIRHSKPLSDRMLNRLANLTHKQIFPKQKLHDGNLCADDEEEFGGLCYGKCADMTAGQYPLRTTAWSCCMEEPCTFLNSKFTNPTSFCDGYDVSGAKENKACPHTPGTCLANEEFNLGMCYKKCALLTNNTFPFRSAASTCCMYNSHWACLDAVNIRTSPEFDVGGGKGDGHASTPNSFHPPIPALTES